MQFRHMRLYFIQLETEKPLDKENRKWVIKPTVMRRGEGCLFVVSLMIDSNHIMSKLFYVCPFF